MNIKQRLEWRREILDIISEKKLKPLKKEELEPLVVLPLFAVFALLISANANHLNDYARYAIGLGAVAVLFTVIGFSVSAGWRMGKRLGVGKDGKR